MSRDHDQWSPFEQLRSHYDEADLACPECGYEDTEGEWEATTTGDTVQYRHVCPSCGATQTRTLSVNQD